MKKKILIIDDSKSLRSAADFTLKSAGFDTVQAGDGVEGLEALKTIDEADIGMIITDINMPNMDGIAFIKEVKKTKFKFVPILVLTTEAQEEKKKEAQQAGASGWLVKPFNSEQLINIVEKFVE
jgi:two-component system chemotaxis response regulator CheY